jgi:acetyltransferase
MHHALRSLLAPASVALVGASERAGALGRIVFENLRGGGYSGDVYAVNPHHRRVFDAVSYRSLSAIGKPVDLAVIATPPASVVSILDDAAKAGIASAVVITAAPPGNPREAARWLDDVAARARSHRIRLVGPGAFGVIRTDLGLNATYSDVAAIRGRLALISQSGAVCTAMLDFASPMGIGFSSVLSLGAEVDADAGELLDALITDPATDGILMYLEDIAHARRFLSALRAAARTKPVVVLKAGRSLASAAPDGAPSGDEVFDAALHRAGTVRVQTYTQLFAAARALAMGRIPAGDRIAIVANGRGAALLAADRAIDVGVSLATLAATTLATLEAILPGESTRGNPVDVRGTADAARYAAALEAVLADANVDAVIALQVPRPIDTPVAIAHAASRVAQASRKPVLAAWLGSVDHHDARAALEEGGIANFYTPENAVEAFSFLAAYRRNQAWLLEAPSSRADIDVPDLIAAEAIRARQRSGSGATLAADDTHALLTAFDIAHVGAKVVQSVAAARAFAVGVHVDPTFGPVITLGAAAYSSHGRRTTMLPPLNRRLARDMVDDCDGVAGDVDLPSREALVRLLLQVSAVVCALPWVRRIALEPVVVGDGAAIVADAHIDIDASRAPAPHYAHMAIHPYPAELESIVPLADGQRLFVRPIRPEDVALEQRFVAALSGQTRYLRFFYQLHELTPQMLARFTQVDYDRELALVALPQNPDGATLDLFVGVARYILDADRSTAEFAIVIADAWQHRGVGRVLMRRLMDAARANGVSRIGGMVLRSNVAMLRFVDTLGFTSHDDPDDAEQVVVTRDLG